VSGQAEVDLLVAALTDPGCDPSKSVNEDAYLTARGADGHLLVVCDGMGGHEGGRLASTTAIQILKSLFEGAAPGTASARFLRQIIETAGRAVHALASHDDPELRPGSTCVALLFTPGRVSVAHVGDSRAYRLRDGAIERLTHDHSVINDLVMAGVMTKAEAQNHPDAHRITRALGMSAQVVVDVRELNDLKASDRFLLCSDGLTDLVGDDELTRILGLTEPDRLEQACVALVELAKQRGGHDNVTAVVAHVADPGTAQRGAQKPAPTEADATSRMPVVSASSTAEADATRRMPVVSAGSTPIAPTVVLGDMSAARLAPTVVESAVHPSRATETQPIAVPSSPTTAAMPASISTPVSAKPRWDTSHQEGSPVPRSSARWVFVAAALSGLVILGLLVWALLH
jgi:PPM family protein phosphatase